MKKKILFYSPYTIFPFHFETELELAEKYLNQGHSVTFLFCDGDLPSCDANPNHKYSICAICKSRRNSGIKWLGKDNVKVENFYQVTEEQKQVIQSFQSIDILSLEQLKNISIDGSDIGMAVYGSVICNLREPYLDPTEYINLIRKNLIAAAIVHFSFKNRLEKDRPNEVIIFNGRMAPLRPVLRLTQSLGITTYVHERAGDLNRYSLTPNIYPHDLNFMKQEIESKVYELLIDVRNWDQNLLFLPMFSMEETDALWNRTKPRALVEENAQFQGMRQMIQMALFVLWC